MEEKKKTSPFVYMLLVAILLGLGYFIIQRLTRNSEDRKAIDKTLKEMDAGR
jgi:preprotein translocase subunit YajC